jgi:prephenate dehydrogenase
MIDRIFVVGTGLIGASTGLALREAGFGGEIAGFDADIAELEEARRAGAIDRFARSREEALEAAGRADVVLLAVPVLAILDWMRMLAPVLGPKHLCTDVGSTKRKIAEMGRQEFGGEHSAQFLPGHPMAGKESGGAGMAEAGLFRGATWLFTPMDGRASTPIEAEWRGWVMRFGAHVIDMDAARHDEICAWVSHLPQMLSTALAALLEETFGSDAAAREEIAAIGGRARDHAAGRESLQHVARCGDDEYRADCGGAACAGTAAGACAGESAHAGVEGRVPAGEQVSRARKRVAERKQKFIDTMALFLRAMRIDQ